MNIISISPPPFNAVIFTVCTIGSDKKSRTCARR